MMLQH